MKYLIIIERGYLNIITRKYLNVVERRYARIFGEGPIWRILASIPERWAPNAIDLESDFDKCWKVLAYSTASMGHHPWDRLKATSIHFFCKN